MIRLLCAVLSRSDICSDPLSSARWTYSICHQLKRALVLQFKFGKNSTASLHGRIFIRIYLQHSQGDLFSSTASERTMTLTDRCCFHHLKWLPTQHLYIWCVFLLNPGVYIPLLITFFKQYANGDLMEPILRSVLSLDLECVLLQMAATLVKHNLWPVGEWCMHGYWGKRVLHCWIFMRVWLIRKWFGAYKSFKY